MDMIRKLIDDSHSNETILLQSVNDSMDMIRKLIDDSHSKEDILLQSANDSMYMIRKLIDDSHSKEDILLQSVNGSMDMIRKLIDDSHLNEDLLSQFANDSMDMIRKLNQRPNNEIFVYFDQLTHLKQSLLQIDGSQSSNQETKSHDLDLQSHVPHNNPDYGGSSNEYNSKANNFEDSYVEEDEDSKDDEDSPLSTSRIPDEEKEK